MAEGVAWKLLPLRAFPDRPELALDNDVILWREPEAVRVWRTKPNACLLAADVIACHSAFGELCGPEPRNSGIRGIPPRFDLERALARVLERLPARLSSEPDEQGLQIAAVSLNGPPLVIRRRKSPFARPSLRTSFISERAERISWDSTLALCPGSTTTDRRRRCA